MPAPLPIAQSPPPKPLPPRRGQHPPRQRHAPKIHRRPLWSNPRNRRHLPDRTPRDRSHRNRHITDHRPLDPQHPAKGPQHPPSLRRNPQQLHHLRLRQHRPDLPRKTSGVARHQRQQPRKPARQPHIRRPRAPAPAARPRHRHNPQPPRGQPRQQPQNLPLHPLHPPPDQQDHHRRHHPRHNPPSHSPRQPIQGQRQPLSRRKGTRETHGQNRNIFPHCLATQKSPAPTTGQQKRRSKTGWASAHPRPSPRNDRALNPLPPLFYGTKCYDCGY